MFQETKSDTEQESLISIISMILSLSNISSIQKLGEYMLGLTNNEQRLATLVHNLMQACRTKEFDEKRLSRLLINSQHKEHTPIPPKWKEYVSESIEHVKNGYNVGTRHTLSIELEMSYTSTPLSQFIELLKNSTLRVSHGYSIDSQCVFINVWAPSSSVNFGKTFSVIELPNGVAYACDSEYVPPIPLSETIKPIKETTKPMKKRKPLSIGPLYQFLGRIITTLLFGWTSKFMTFEDFVELLPQLLTMKPDEVQYPLRNNVMI